MIMKFKKSIKLATAFVCSIYFVKAADTPPAPPSLSTVIPYVGEFLEQYELAQLAPVSVAMNKGVDIARRIQLSHDTHKPTGDANFLTHYAQHNPDAIIESVFGTENIIKAPTYTANIMENIDGIFVLSRTQVENIFLPLIFGAPALDTPWQEWQKIAVSHFFQENKFLLRARDIDSDEAQEIIFNKLSTSIESFRRSNYISITHFLDGNKGLVAGTKREIIDRKSELEAALRKNPNSCFIMGMPITRNNDYFRATATARREFAIGISLTADEIPSNLKHLAITSRHNETTIINYEFLAGHRMLSSVDFSALPQVSLIQDDFLMGCTNLEFINMSVFSQVTRVGEFFLAQCERLRRVNLSQLPNLKMIEDHFLSGATGIETLNFSPLKKIRAIGGRFLERTNIRMIECGTLKMAEMFIPNQGCFETDFSNKVLFLDLTEQEFRQQAEILTTRFPEVTLRRGTPHTATDTAHADGSGS